ncbi:hypothetical protein Tco_1532231 [Tanacetum coccineum]
MHPPWCCDDGNGADDVVVAVGWWWVYARGGAWWWGSGRSGDGEAFGTWSENSPKKFSGGRRWRRSGGGGRRKKRERWRYCALVGGGGGGILVGFVDVRRGGATTTVTSLDAGQGSSNIAKTPSMPYDSPLLRGHTLECDEGRMQHNELMDLVTKLSDIVESLEIDLKQTKQIYGTAFTKLIKKFEFDFDAAKEVSTTEKDVSIAKPVSTAGAAVTTASVAISTARVSTDDDITLAETLVNIRKSAAKDKGKAKMDESETVQTKTKLQQEQERLGYEAPLSLQEQLDEEEKQRIARLHESASSFNIEEWHDIQARIEADEELAVKLQAEEREKYSEAEKARLLAELINQRKRHLAQQRAEERRNKPPTQAQQRTYMCNYIKHMGSYTLQQLKGYSFEEIKTLFETSIRRVKAFVPIKSEVPKLAAGSSKRDAEEELGQQSSKKQKLDEPSQEELQQLMIIVPEEGMNIEALFNSTEPTEDKEREIWVELKRLFEPDADDELWKSHKHIHDITWRLYDTCGVHHVSTKDGVGIYMLVEREYPLSRGVITQMLVAKLLVDQDNEMSRELIRKIFMLAERLRSGCNGCMLSDNHDLCVLNFINDVNARAKFKSVKKISKRKVWKPTGKVYIKTGFTWRPTGRFFTILGNACPLTRITTTTEVPQRKPTALETDADKPIVTLVYSRKPRKTKTTAPVSKPKIIKSISAYNKEPSKSWGSTVSDFPSSSLNNCRLSKLFSVIWTPAAPSI